MEDGCETIRASAFKDPWKEYCNWVECLVLQWIQTVDVCVILGMG